MKILLVAPQCPLPLLNGIRLRTFHLFSRLSQRHDIALLTFASRDDRKQLPALREVFSEVHLVPEVYRSSIQDYAIGALSTVPFYVKRMECAEMGFQVKRLLSSGRYDIVHVSDARMAGYLVGYPGQAKVVDACDCLALLYRRAFSQARNLSERLNYLQLWIKTRAYESQVYTKFDRCIVVSRADAEALRASSPSLAPKVVPNGVDTDYFRPSPRALINQGPTGDVVPDSFVFVGVMNYAPNVDAARYFAAEILPKVAYELPSASFRMVGRTPTKEVFDLLAASNVHLFDDVDDIRPHVLKSAVFVCPLRVGAGVKNKLLEAMAMGKPVVATTLACEGLEVRPGQELLVADDANDFAESCVGLVQRPDKGAEMADRARLLVERRYSWQLGVEALEATLAEVTYERRIGLSLA
ncbi:MAG: glycosyltransferase [Chloroflexi bacterium]|nr:glycosyltransferase [Chloroflexota bacterium]